MGYCVYMHTAPNGKVYIGITMRNPEHRWNNGKGYTLNKHFTNAILKYGWDNIKHEILYDDLTKEEACAKERELIALYRSNSKEHGYNKSVGGENPAEGAVWSAETREKHMAICCQYRPTEETKRKISEAKRGRSNGLEGRVGKLSMKSKLVLQISEQTGEVLRVFYGYNEMARETGFKRTPVMETAQGIRKRAYGYKWKQMERGELNVSI